MFRRFRVWGVGVYVKYRGHGFGFSLEAQFLVVSWATVAVPYRIWASSLPGFHTPQCMSGLQELKGSTS